MMATAKLHLRLSIRDMKRTKLFVYELHELRSRMVVACDPFASDLDRIIDRFSEGGDDDDQEEEPT